MAGHPTRRIVGIPHVDDCIDTLCPACGCCCHCADDDHCPGADGCAAEGCSCGDVA